MLEFRDEIREPAIQLAATTIQAAELQGGSAPLIILISETSIREGDSELTFAVTLSRPADQPIAILYATADGTATAGLDYEPTQGVMVFEPGELRAEVSQPPRGTHVVEARFDRATSVDAYRAAVERVRVALAG